MGSNNREIAMKTMLGITVIVSLFVGSSAIARNERLTLSVTDALNAPDAVEKLDKNVPLFFGKQRHPPIVKKLGTFTANNRTNSFGKSDKRACDWAFLSAMLKFQARAVREGGNAVVNIRSNYRNHLFSSQRGYTCGAGNFVAGVTFMGTVVELKK